MRRALQSWALVCLGGCGSASSAGPGAARATANVAPAPVTIAAEDAGSAAPIAAPTALDVPAPSPEFDVPVVRDPEWRHQTATAAVHAVQLPALSKRWAARVGKTTFRTTMARAGDALVIGTHGATLGGKNEPSDGIYVLEAATGKQRAFFKTPGTGDLDIGGIAVSGNTVYFTADNGQAGAMDLASGRLLWKAALHGKVRAAPALAHLDKDGHVDVVVGDEEGSLYALDGRSGAELWHKTTGVNDYDAKGFIAAAAIVDIGGDGSDDVIAGARDGILTAYRGSDGRILWQQKYDSGIHASPSIADFDQDGKPEVLAAWSYGQVGIFDAATGTPRWVTRLEQDDGGIEGLFGSPIPVPGAPGVLVAPTAWWGKGDGVIGVGVGERVFRAYEDRVSASAVVMDLNGDGKNEAIIGTEKGRLIALTADGGHAVLATLGGPIEATALIDDTDGDGRYEVLVASNDGLLTCLQTSSTSKPVVARFRGNGSDNRGDLGPIKLGWRSTATPRADGDRAGAGSNGSIRLDYLTCCTALTDASTRAPSPENVELLRAASLCNSLAAADVDRALVLDRLAAQLRGKATLPPACTPSTR